MFKIGDFVCARQQLGEFGHQSFIPESHPGTIVAINDNLKYGITVKFALMKEWRCRESDIRILERIG